MMRMAKIQDVVLSVPDISCQHCVKTINGVLATLPGVELVTTDLPTKSVHLRYDADLLSREQIETTLDEAGYTVANEPPRTPRMSGKPLNLL
jgi:copper chaperone